MFLPNLISRLYNINHCIGSNDRGAEVKSDDQGFESHHNKMFNACKLLKKNKTFCLSFNVKVFCKIFSFPF